MTLATSVNDPNPRTDKTVRIFDQFYQYDAQVPAEEYDIVNSFFQSVFNSKLAANNFTVTLFRVAQESKTPVLTLLQTLQQKNKIELDTTLAYYINGLRSLTTLLGVGQIVSANYYAARNVIE